jgi:hypothetical protein
MILSEDQTKGLLNEAGIYEWSLIKRRWSNLIFGSETSSVGNIVTFLAPLNVGDKQLTKVLVVAADLPNVEMFGGICFQRLLTAQIGSILCELINKSCHVDESSIFVEKKQASISVANHVKGSTLFHNVISMCSQNSDLFYPILLDQQTLVQFQEKIIGAFQYLTKSVFLETQRDNF